MPKQGAFAVVVLLVVIFIAVLGLFGLGLPLNLFGF